MARLIHAQRPLVILGVKFSKDLSSAESCCLVKNFTIRCFSSANNKVREVNVEKTPITSELWKQRMEAQASNSPDALDDQSFLLDKKASDSRKEIKYIFDSNPDPKQRALRDLYINNRGNIAMGKILEDMDALAGNIAFSHCDDNNPKTRPLSLVTASVEKIRLELQSEIAMGNIVLVGQVGWVGKSSLDIVVEIHKAEKSAADGSNHTNSNILSLVDPNSKTRLLSSVFTYVARNKITGKSATVNKLNVTDAPAIEKNFFNEREEIMKKRKSVSAAGASAVSAESKVALQALVDSGSAILDMPALAHPNAVLMRSTTLENSFICQPQHVNTAHKVFGGFLMRRAYDLAAATSYTFAGKPAHLHEIDRINFKHPVEIGDLVRLKSKIVYSNNDPIKPSVVCEVICQIVRPEKTSSSVSNTFNFTFGFSDQVNPRRVLPSSMEEAESILKYSADFTSI